MVPRVATTVQAGPWSLWPVPTHDRLLFSRELLGLCRTFRNRCRSMSVIGGRGCVWSRAAWVRRRPKDHSGSKVGRRVLNPLAVSRRRMALSGKQSVFLALAAKLLGRPPTLAAHMPALLTCPTTLLAVISDSSNCGSVGCGCVDVVIAGCPVRASCVLDGLIF